MNKGKNVYGENHPKEDDARVPKDKDTGQDLEDTRRKMSKSGQSGGMGREGTPKPAATQGEWGANDV